MPHFRVPMSLDLGVEADDKADADYKALDYNFGFEVDNACVAGEIVEVDEDGEEIEGGD